MFNTGTALFCSSRMNTAQNTFTYTFMSTGKKMK